MDYCAGISEELTPIMYLENEAESCKELFSHELRWRLVRIMHRAHGDMLKKCSVSSHNTLHEGSGRPSFFWTPPMIHGRFETPHFRHILYASSPLFIIVCLNQIKNALAPGVADPNGRWHDCEADILNCSPIQLKIMQGFASSFSTIPKRWNSWFFV